MWNHFKPLIFDFRARRITTHPVHSLCCCDERPALEPRGGPLQAGHDHRREQWCACWHDRPAWPDHQLGTTRLATGRGKAERVLQDNRHAGGGNARLATLLQRRRPCIVPASKIATVERVNAATMHRAAEYKDNAQECRELAKRMLRRGDSDALERIAQIWERLAKLPERQPEPESELPITR